MILRPKLFVVNSAMNKINLAAIALSNDSVDLGGVLERQVNHLGVGNLEALRLLGLEVNALRLSIIAPDDTVAHAVLRDEGHQLILFVDHEHLGHVLHAQRLVGTLS